MIFVAKIHNNQLGETIEVETYEDGVRLIKIMAEKQLERPLTAEELSEIENEYSLYNDEDSDNLYTWAIGITSKEE